MVHEGSPIINERSKWMTYEDWFGIWIFFTRIPSLIIFLCILAVIFWPYIERIYRKLMPAGPKGETGS
jgi:hypothetical protein